MPRRARLSLPGIPWHIIQRGHNRSACFFGDADRLCYLNYLGEFAETFECSIHAYVLMTNHVHLLLTPQRPDGAAQLMKHLGQRYVQYINRVFNRTGTLWEGRFRSCLVQCEVYLLACYRYIELNPVRAGIVERPQDYCWSSYRSNALGEVNRLLSPHGEYLRLGRDRVECQAAYRDLFHGHFADELLKEIRSTANRNLTLGSTEFAKAIARH